MKHTLHRSARSITGSKQLYTLLAAITFLFTGGNLLAQTQTFSYTGSAQTYTVPAGATAISVKIWGAGGAGSLYTGAGYAGSGGSGALVKGNITVTPGQTLTIIVGGGGKLSVSAASTGGYAGGGASGGAYGGSGGGYSGIFSSSTLSQANALAIAGGGAGGGYYYQTTNGGGGGATTGSGGGNVTTTYTGGGGGSLTAGGTGGRFNGTARGSAGTALNGGTGGVYAVGGGGGGGGYYGGGGGYGAAASSSYYSSGGGGGSSYLGSMSGTTNTAGTVSTTSVANQAPGAAESGYVAGVGNGGSGNVSTTASAGGNGLIVITATSGCTTPAAQPTVLNLSAVASATATSTINGSFTAATTLPSGYVILRSTSSTAPTLTNGTGYTTGTTVGGYYVVRGTDVTNTATTFADTGLISNTQYYYYIASFSSGCSGQPYYLTTGMLTGSTVSCAAAPTAPTATSDSVSATISWTAATTGGGAGSYTYTLQISPTNTFSTVTAYPGVTSGYTVTGLAAGTYYYRIKANNGSCESVYSTTGSFTICTSFNSIIAIGGSTIPGSQYGTLTEVITALANCGITQPTTLLLNSNYTSSAETFPITIPVISGSNSTNTLTIKPGTGVTATISGALASGALIKVLNSNTIIDGANTEGGETLNLTLTNTATTGPNVLLIGSAGTTPITNVIVKNTYIVNGANTSTAFMLSDSSTPGSAGYFNDIIIQNNNIQNAYVGMFINASTTVTTNGSGLSITENTLNASGANAITARAIYIAGVGGAAEISGNIIGNINCPYANDLAIGILANAGTNNLTLKANIIAGITATATTGTATGIYINSGATNVQTKVIKNTISGITSSGTYIDAGAGIYLSDATANVTINANRVSNIKHTSGYGVSGIFLSSTATAANTLVSNNMVWDVAGTGNTNAYANGNGIFVYEGGGYKIYNNSVNMATNQTSGIVSALYVYSSVTVAGAIDVRNNILSNTQTTGTRYAIYSAAANTVFSNIDYNDYYSAGPALGYIGSERTTLANVQTGFGDNAHSVSISPSFVSATDLHLTVCTTLEATGAFLVSKDIDDDNRTSGATEMGADEVNGISPPTITTVTGASNCGSGWGMLSATGSAGVTEYRWYTALTGGSYTATNTGNYTVSASTTTTYYVTAYNGTCESDTRTAVTLSIQPVAPAPVFSPSSVQGCPGTVYPLSISNAVTSGAIMSQNFTGVATGALPTGWTKVQPTTTTIWGVLASATAGGTSPEMAINCLNSTSTETGQYILYAPVMNTTGLGAVQLSLKQRISHYSSAYVYTLKIQASTDNATWNTLWALTPTANLAATTTTLSLANYSDKPAVYLRFMLEGMPFGCIYWDLDDIAVTGTVPTYTWEPTTGLYTDATTTTAYTGGSAATVYAKPTETSLYTVTATQGGCTTTGNISVTLVAEWTGALSTDWNTAGNWCGNVLPLATNNVIIPAAINLPVINAGYTGYAHNLTVGENAGINVSTGATLSVENILTVHNTATLNIANNGALLQGESITTDLNDARIVINKKGSNLFRLDYTLWSSPVTGQNLAAFSPATTTNRFYTYNPASDAYATVAPASNSFAPAKGYLIRMPNADSTPNYNTGGASFEYNGVFTGAPGNGDVSISLPTGYNAVGNPYPSPVNLHDFFFGNSGNINGSSGIYLWRKRNDASSLSTSYATLTLAAFAYNSGNEAGGAENESFYEYDATTGSDNWVIAPAQGFIVNVTGAGINFTNSMRRGTPGTTQSFFRQATRSASRLWVNMTNTTGARSQAAIAYIHNATLGTDYGYDARNFAQSGTISFYSLAEDTGFTIQARPEFTDADVVPMGYVAPTAGSYTITLDRTDGVFSQGQIIFLKDNLTGTVTNLTEGSYTFVSEAGVFNTRFNILYNTINLGTSNPVESTANAIVYKQDTTIHIDAGNNVINNISIYDLRGRRVYRNEYINATATAVTNLTAEQQVLIVEINTIHGKISKRIIF